MHLDGGALLSGRIARRHIEIRGLDLLLERGPDGQPNWALGSAGPGGAAPDRAAVPLLPETVRVRGSRIGYLAGPGTETRSIEIPALEAERSAEAGLSVQARAEFRGEPLQASVAAGPANADAPWPLRVQVESDSGRLQVEGRAPKPGSIAGLEAELELSVAEITGLPAPLTGVRLEGASTTAACVWRAASCVRASISRA